MDSWSNPERSLQAAAEALQQGRPERSLQAAAEALQQGRPERSLQAAGQALHLCYSVYSPRGRLKPVRHSAMLSVEISARCAYFPSDSGGEAEEGAWEGQTETPVQPI